MEVPVKVSDFMPNYICSLIFSSRGEYAICLGLLMFACSSMPLLSLPEQPHHTSAYFHRQGSLHSYCACTTYSTKHFWNKEGRRLPSFNKFENTSCSLYLNYTLQSLNSIFINLAYSMIEESMNGKSQGLNDFQFTWKHGFPRYDDSAIAFQLTGIVPAGRLKSSLRYGKIGVELQGLYSNILGTDLWYDLALGYRVYQGFPSDQIRADATLGWKAHSCIEALMKGEFIGGIWNGTSEANRNNISNHANYSLLKVHLELIGRIHSLLRVSLGGFWHVWGRNVGSGGGVFGAGWVDF